MTRGFLVSGPEKDEPDSLDLAVWEKHAADAVGNFIEFWGFKHNHGKVWTCLYIRGGPMAAVDLQKLLGLSKGAVSMITRELERWSVIHRVRVENSSSWHFVAETDLMAMINRVLKERESDMVARVRADLDEAQELAVASEDPDSQGLARLQRIHALSRLVAESISNFVATGKIDIFKLADILRDVQDFNKNIPDDQ